MRSAVDAGPVEERLQDSAPLVPEQKFRHEGVLLADLALVFREPGLGGPQDREVDVDEKPLIGRVWKYAVSGGQYELLNPSDRLFRYPGRKQCRSGPFCALFLIVVPPELVDGVVKPQPHFDLGGMHCQPTHRFEAVDALGKMPQRMVLPMGLRVPGDEIRKRIGAFGLSADALPSSLPGFP